MHKIIYYEEEISYLLVLYVSTCGKISIDFITRKDAKPILEDQRFMLFAIRSEIEKSERLYV